MCPCWHPEPVEGRMLTLKITIIGIILNSQRHNSKKAIHLNISLSLFAEPKFSALTSVTVLVLGSGIFYISIAP